MQLSKEPLGSGPKRNAGFTLIELAIVLVVIGLIIAAVLKGEDLIQNARMLDFITNPVQKAQTEALAYYDRTGQFPSQQMINGALFFPLSAMYNAGINGVLDLKNPYNVGDVNLSIAFQVVQYTDSGGNVSYYPAIIINPTGGAQWNQSEVGYIDYLKSEIDGNSNDFTTGSVRYLSAPIGFAPQPMTSYPTGATNLPTDERVIGCIQVNGQWFYPLTSADFANPTNGSWTTGSIIFFYNDQPHN